MTAMTAKLVYQKRAVDCAARAASAKTDKARDVWHRMEKYWRRRADECDVPLVPEQASTDLDDLVPMTRRSK